MHISKEFEAYVLSLINHPLDDVKNELVKLPGYRMIDVDDVDTGAVLRIPTDVLYGIITGTDASQHLNINELEDL
ncbi:hypothetical protein [Serratia quinivorans]|uniref:hypothetical protein n=1 Tax=Serratia quinivorans TaxID=137545 RepID=UPI00217B5844|nr:hypothetical protein [Serratia quinivorans]CAI0895659.1 Uncharacterised protein [Serratia quinivorans]